MKDPVCGVTHLHTHSVTCVVQNKTLDYENGGYCQYNNLFVLAAFAAVCCNCLKSILVNNEDNNSNDIKGIAADCFHRDLLPLRKPRGFSQKNNTKISLVT